VTFHPSFILREERDNGGMRVKRQVWEDMLAVMDFLRMPVSEKQRGYFSGG
jgi:DNA polymerase